MSKSINSVIGKSKTATRRRILRRILSSVFWTRHRRIPILNVRRRFSIPLPISQELYATDDFAEELIQRICLSGAVSALPEDQKEVLLLRYGQDMKVAEVAEILGFSRFQVIYRIRSALKQLNKSLGKEGRQ